jgi:hypothetical protein
MLDVPADNVRPADFKEEGMTMDELKYREIETRLINVALLITGMDIEGFLQEVKKREVDGRTNGLSAIMPTFKVRILAEDALEFKRAVARYSI